MSEEDEAAETAEDRYRNERPERTAHRLFRRNQSLIRAGRMNGLWC